jgi:DNA-binding protein YbaB
MAKGGREHRMVFDIRGRRRHVVKVVYALLAILMAGSLFLVVGPVNIGSLLGTSGGSSNPAQPYEEEAAKVERKLKKDPEDPELLQQLTHAQVNAGNQSIETNSSGEQALTVTAVQHWQKASESWSKYLKATDEPEANLAQLMSTMLFTLASSASRTTDEALSNVAAAATAQRIVAEARPSLNSLSTLAFYEDFAQNYKAAEKAGNEAKKLTGSKFERESFENKLEEVSKQARKFGKQVKEAEKELKQRKKSGETPESLESGTNPFGSSLGGGLTE